jgi:hypothetical protein
MKGTGREGSSFDQVGRGEQTATTWPVCTRYAGGLAGLAGQPSQDSGRNSLELCRFYSMTAGPHVPVHLFCLVLSSGVAKIPGGGPVARPPGPHPYQGSAREPVSAGSRLQPARTTYRWRPLETVGNRSAPMACGPDVDQARRSRGQRRSASRTLPTQGRPPPAAPDKRAPPATALLGGALAGSGPGTSPCIDGLSLVTSRVIPQQPSS